MQRPKGEAIENGQLTKYGHHFNYSMTLAPGKVQLYHALCNATVALEVSSDLYNARFKYLTSLTEWPEYQAVINMWLHCGLCSTEVQVRVTL